MRLRTPVCDLLGIEHPIFGAAMGGVALVDLAVAVSDAGGCGTLGLTSYTPDEIRTMVREVRRRTSKPFGVGLMFPQDIPAATVEVPPELPDFLRPAWERVRDLPLPPPRPTLTEELARAQLAALVEERVPLLACGLGTPAWVVERAHAAGMKVASLVGSLQAARAVDALGVDLVVAQGHEAGGHTGQVTSLVLIPQVAEAVRAPVLAAGGIADGRGVAAALALGAQGVWVGTRLLATPEAATAEGHKRRVVDMESDETVVSRCYTGKPSRILRNAFVTLWALHQSEILPMPAQRVWMERIVDRARAAGVEELVNYPTGQVAARVHAITPAAEVVREMAQGAARTLTDLQNQVVFGREVHP